jgi:hypothetical protein
LKRIDTEISINGTVFKGANSIEISSSWEDMTDICRILVPNAFKRDNKNITVGDEGFFKRGDEITVKTGYFPNLETRFEGFVRNITPDNLIAIDCEDLLFKLKQEPVTKSFKSIKLTDFLKELTTEKFLAVDATLGKFRISRSTVAKVLEELKKSYGLISFVRDKVLKVGLAYYPDEAKTIVLSLDGQNGNTASNNLEFIDSNELQIVVKGSSMQSDNKIVERWAYYDLDNKLVLTSTDPKKGETDTLSVPLQTSKELDGFITQRLEKRLSTGITGTVTAFLEPVVRHGDIIDLKSKKFPEKEGKYFVKRVTTTMTVSGGGRQEIELDIKK